MPSRWVALPPTMKHRPESGRGLRISFISVIKKIAFLELSSLLIIHYIKEVPLPIQQTHRITEKDSLIQFSSKKYGKPWAMAEWIEIFRVAFTEKGKRHSWEFLNKKQGTLGNVVQIHVCRLLQTWLLALMWRQPRVRSTDLRALS